MKARFLIALLAVGTIAAAAGWLAAKRSTSLACMLRGQGQRWPVCANEASSIAMMVIGKVDFRGAVATLSTS